MSERYSMEYVRHQQRGPFTGQIDPWAEDGHYFQQIHANMISRIQDQLQDELNERGYKVGRETSLQVFANRKPDIYIQRPLTKQPPAQMDYVTIAAELAVDPGTRVLDEEPELDALHIYEFGSHELISVIEIISPSNKTHPADMQLYRDQRESLFLSQNVSVVEIDATRSFRRLLRVTDHAYHIAVHLPGELPRILVSDFGEPIKPFALPLRGEGVRVETQAAYDWAYQRGGIAALINDAGHYMPDLLPFPSMLTQAQHQSAIAAVEQWQTELARLREA